MTKLSVNVNKIATIRNARGGFLPDPVKAAITCENAGANGITVHPRPDERHITKNDVYRLKEVVQTEYNIEGYPSNSFIDMVLDVCPDQVTLVPDPPEVLTSNNGWDCIEHQDFLTQVIATFHQKGIRTSIFLNPEETQIESAKNTGTDRIELYTESFANGYSENRQAAIAPFVKTAQKANDAGLGINAGHDLNLENLGFFQANIPQLLEVSIGHALINDALYLGMTNAVKAYLHEVNPIVD